MRILKDAGLLILPYGLVFCLFLFVFPIYSDPEGAKAKALKTRLIYAFGIDHEQEMALGDNIVAVMLDRSTVTRSEAILAPITDRLLKNLGETYYEYKFHIIREEEPNAFALPGGHIVVHTGLIQFADSPEQIAGVLAHEIGHVERRHSINRLGVSLGISFLLSGITDSGNMGQLLETALSMKFSRNQEEEADDVAFDLCIKSGIHPRHLSQFFKKIEDKYGDTDGITTLISTHPELKERQEKIMKRLKEVKIKEVPLEVEIEDMRNAIY